MPYRHTYACLLASSRRNSEDRVEVIERAGELVVVVADGAGGLRGGAAASDAAVARIRAAALDPACDAHDVQTWMSLLTDLDRALAEATAGETTAIVALVGRDGVHGASVGDSQAWVVTETRTDDLTVGQARKRLGSGRATPVSFHRPRLEGTLVVATDGLWSYLPIARIAEAARRRTPADSAERLRALVQLPSGTYQDDVGVVVIASAADVEEAP